MTVGEKSPPRHWLDALYVRFSPRSRLFEEGWGDFERWIVQARPLRERPEPTPLGVRWGRERRWFGLAISDGEAPSPLPGLKGEVATVYLRRLAPQGRPTRGRLVVMCSWADEGWLLRQPLLLPLAFSGLELWLLEGAYFGRRRLSAGLLHLPTVADFFALGLANVTEARSALASLRAMGDAPVGLAGYSMGGHLASQAALTLPWPIRLAALVPSHSAAPVFVDGPLSRNVVWPALGENAKQKLTEVLERVNAHALPAPLPGARTVVVATRRDGIVPAHSMEALAAKWGVAPRWVDTGHVGAFLLRRPELRRAVLDVMAGAAG
ncbi:MAG: alpha/beta hydrolase family protein [Myxococcales bacterium]|nr:alpha/beta hydrolase family protein [Myxococcales bacterium]